MEFSKPSKYLGRV